MKIPDPVRTTISAKDLLDACLQVEGTGGSLITIPDEIPRAEHIETKLMIYRLAALSYAIITAGRKRESLLPLQASLETRVFTSADDETAATMRTEMRDAVRDIHHLIASDNKLWARWARSWFASANHDLTNFVTAGLFAMSVVAAVTHHLKVLDMYEVTK